jgi:hypothetical protein
MDGNFDCVSSGQFLHIFYTARHVFRKHSSGHETKRMTHAPGKTNNCKEI